MSPLPRSEHSETSNDDGFALIELLVAAVIIALMSMGVAYSLMASLRTAKFTEVNHAATSLAISRMEELAAIDTLELDEDDSGTETAVAWPDLDFTFTRVTTVTVNAEESRTVTVTVTSNNVHVPTTVELSTTLALWE